MARAFYARKEPWFPFLVCLIRMVLYVIIGLTAIPFFPRSGAPAIAVAELPNGRSHINVLVVEQTTTGKDGIRVPL